MTKCLVSWILRIGGIRDLASAVCVWAGLGGLTSLPAADGLRPRDIVAICGDSITKQGLYSTFIETYLLACQQVKDVHAHQFGLNNETSWDFLTRIDSEVLLFQPTAATLYYGMNDGGYSSVDPRREASYRRATTEIVRKLREAGVRFIVVGSPGAVDTTTFDKNFLTSVSAQEYNAQTLSGLAKIARQVAAEQGVAYADVHGLFSETMAKAKAKHGPGYHVAGADGIHPAANGHLIIAYAFLKALGCDGDIGTISVDLPKNSATATDGHRVLSFTNGAIELESTRYPFCFFGNPSDPNSTRGIIEFLPFNSELNRFRLVVSGTSRMKVTWGETSKTFSANELAKGVNLAAEFLDNPFSEPVKAVENEVRRQQEYETQGMKWHYVPGWAKTLSEEQASVEKLADDVLKKARALEAAARAAVKPVKHTLKIEPLP
jgi:lysophospholipase L1-like esterase